MSSTGDDYAFGYDGKRRDTFRAGATPAAPLTEARVREIVREELAEHGRSVSADPAASETGKAGGNSAYSGEAQAT